MRAFLEMRRLGEMDSFENYVTLGSDFFTALLLSVYAFLVLRDVYKLRRRGELTGHVEADTPISWLTGSEHVPVTVRRRSVCRNPVAPFAQIQPSP